MRDKACSTCHRLELDTQQCASCKTYTLSPDWSGLVIIVNPEGSKVATKLNIDEPGKYALKVR